MSLTFGPTTNLAVVDTAQIGNEAATSPYSTTDTGPITVTLPGSTAGPDPFQVKYVTVLLDQPYLIEVSASYRLGIFSPGGAGWTVKHGVGYGNTAGTSWVLPQGLDKNGVNLYEQIGSTAQFSLSTGTYRIGIGCQISDTTASDVDAIFRDISIAIKVLKR